MKPEHSTQDELQRALALKRREQPPRTFFKSLSEKVMDRLQNPEPPPEPTLTQRLGLDFDKKPVWICLLGLAVCALLAFGLISSRGVKEPPRGTPDPLGPRSLRGSATGLDGASLMPTPQAKSEAAGGSEPLMAPDTGSRIAPRPRPAATSVTTAPAPAPGNPGQ
jgi:hypothetical protein